MKDAVEFYMKNNLDNQDKNKFQKGSYDSNKYQLSMQFPINYL